MPGEAKAGNQERRQPEVSAWEEAEVISPRGSFKKLGG